MPISIKPGRFVLMGGPASSSPPSPPAPSPVVMTAGEMVLLWGTGPASSSPPTPVRLTPAQFAMLFGTGANPLIPPPSPVRLTFEQYLLLQRSPVYIPPVTMTAVQYLLMSSGVQVVPRTFLAAVKEKLISDVELMAMLPGGWWHRQIPPPTPLPAGLYLIPTSQNTDIGGTHFLQDGLLQIQVYGPVAENVRVIADRVCQVLSDQTMVWQTGRLMELRASQPSSPGKSIPGRRAADIFGEIRTFKYMLSGRYDAPVPLRP